MPQKKALGAKSAAVAPSVLATLRKQRQRARLRANGLVRLDVWVPQAALEAIDRAASAMGTSMKDECAALLTHLATRHAESATNYTAKAAALWAKAAPLWPYSKFLQQPGQVFRVGAQEFRSDDWLAIEPELLRVFSTLSSQRGWDSRRVLAFFRHCAKHAGR